MNIVKLYVNEKNVVSNCELAVNFLTRFKGLMFRKEKDFKKGQGMLFDNCSSIHMFFMNFPIDVIYMDKHFKVTKVVENLKQNQLSIGTKDTFYTLELPVGESKHFKVGDNVYIEN